MPRKAISPPALDWRYRTVTTLSEDWKSPFTSIVHKKGSPVSLSTFVKHGDTVLQIGDPSGPALFLSHAEESHAHALRLHPFRGGRRTQPGKDPSRRAYDYLQAIMASIVFSFTAIEAFANEEIPEAYVREHQRNSGIYVPQGKDDIERWVDLSEKLAAILPGLKKVPSPKGLALWRDFVLLKRVRDRIIHMKSSDRRHSNKDEMYPDSIWAQLLAPDQPNYPLIAKTMISHFMPGKEPHWLIHCPIRERI